MSRIHKLVAATGTALLLAAAAATPAAAAPQPRTSIAALGDSYAAGYGIALPSAQNPCAQSAKAYPLKLSPGRADVEFLACSGATTMSNTDMPINTVLAQLEGISPDAQIVTLTVGGNDIGWAPTILSCLSADTEQEALACQLALAAAPGKITALGGDIASLVVMIKAQAPDAKVFVTGYPLLFQPTSTNACAAYPVETQVLLGTFDDLAMGLNAAIEAGAERADATFVDVTDEFAGHGLCDADDSWLFADNLHPTVAGQNAYARALRVDGVR